MCGKTYQGLHGFGEFSMSVKGTFDNGPYLKTGNRRQVVMEDNPASKLKHSYIICKYLTSVQCSDQVFSRISLDKPVITVAL